MTDALFPPYTHTFLLLSPSIPHRCPTLPSPSVYLSSLSVYHPSPSVYFSSLSVYHPSPSVFSPSPFDAHPTVKLAPNFPTHTRALLPTSHIYPLRFVLSDDAWTCRTLRRMYHPRTKITLKSKPTAPSDPCCFLLHCPHSSHPLQVSQWRE